MSWVPQSVSAAIRSTNPTATADTLTCETTARQVGHKPAPVAGLVSDPLINAERRAHDSVNLEPAIGGADPEGGRAPARRCQRRCARLVRLGLLHARMHRALRGCLIFVGPFQNVQHVPARLS